MEKTPDPQIRTEPKTRLVDQIKICLQSGDYSRALDLLRGASTEFPNDADLSALEKLAQDGIQRNADANRLITESQELFAQQKSAEALQLLRKAYELDKRNSLARAILANALVEHANAILETDWLGAETLTNQALALNPAHPTAKTIQSLIVEQKKNSSAEDWVAQASKLHSSGDLFAALAWVAEGMAVHPDDPKLLQVQEAIQRDQAARRRQARRGDLEDLRRMEREVASAADVDAKQALAERIQAVAAKHWTDGEILSIANALLLRLGLVGKESTASPGRKGAALILHVPRPGTANPPRADAREIPPKSMPIPAAVVPPAVVQPEKVSPVVVPAAEAPIASPPPPPIPPAQITSVTIEPPAAATKVAFASSRQKQERISKPVIKVILVSAGAVVLVALTFFFTREHYVPPVSKTPAAAASASAPAATAAAVPAPAVSSSEPATIEATSPQPSAPVPDVSSDLTTEKAAVHDDAAAASPAPKLGTLVVVAGQDGAQVSLNGKLQTQRTQAGQLLLPNLEPRDYVVQVSKSGYQDPPQQKIHLRNSEQTRLVFNLQPKVQPQPRMASLTIQGGVPETTVLVDQNVVGTIPADGTLSASTIEPGDHTVELRKERFNPRQLRRHFVAGGTISLAAADAALDAASGELKISFSPADATVAIAKGDLLKVVSSGVPLSLAAGTYTLTTRTAERVTRSSTIEVVGGQSKNLDLSLGPTGMSKWEDAGAWKPEKDSFVRKGGDFVLYGVAPASGTFIFSAMPAKGHLLQWVLNYSDPKNYILCQMDENSFYRAVVRNGEKTEQVKIPDIGDKKGFRTLQIRVSATEIVHQVKHGDRWTALDRWTRAGANLGSGKFGFYLPGNDQVTLSSFAHYADLSIR